MRDAWAGWPALRELLAERPLPATSLFDEAYDGDRPMPGAAGGIARLRQYLRLRHRRMPWTLPA
jgi:hypothetical protein